MYTKYSVEFDQYPVDYADLFVHSTKNRQCWYLEAAKVIPNDHMAELFIYIRCSKEHYSKINTILKELVIDISNRLKNATSMMLW